MAQTSQASAAWQFRLLPIIDQPSVMDPNEFIHISGKIAAMPGWGEAGARTAVSRAYYGAFHLAASLLENLDCTAPRSGQGHTLVPRFFRASENEDALDAGSLLDDLYEERRRADYDVNDARAETARFARLGVETSHRIRACLQRFRQACGEPMVLEQFRQGVAEVKRAHGVP